MKWVPQIHWQTINLMEANLEYLEEKSNRTELSIEEKEHVEGYKRNIASYKEFVEKADFCPKCSCVIEDEKTPADLWCQCKYREEMK